ncbi:MAG: HAD-IA family hydrolase [Pirellulales bacterium]|nr:HAD-IA family hydrolase [Pirellulales bacterium]
MPLRAVAFDMDGLMFNTEDVYTAVGDELLGRRGRQFTSELKDAMMGLPPQASFERMIEWHELDDSWEALVPESEEIFIELLDGILAPMPGLMNLLDALEAAGVPKGVATSSGRRLTDTILTRAGVARRFAFVLTCENITYGKPDPEIYLLAAKQFGVSPSEMMVLEDSSAGCRAAAAAGAFVVAVPNEHTDHHDFSPATLVASGLNDRRIYEALGLAAPAD